MKKFEPKLITEIYDHLKPELMKVFAVSKNFEGKTDKSEKWYGTQYKTEKFSSELIEELKNCGLNDAFKLPLKNDFIPQDFTLLKHENGVDEFPVVIHKSPVKRLWYKGDEKFLLPKASIKFEFRNPLTNLDPVNYNMTALFIELLCDSLTEYTYAADLAGLRYSVNQTNYGIQVNPISFCH
jgi:insulysin